jgi:hypothetical protein
VQALRPAPPLFCCGKTDFVDRRLIGRCGVYCGACEIHRAYKDSPALRVSLAQKHGCELSEVVCEGCQQVHARGWTGHPEWGKNCKVLRCLAQHKYRFCFECPDYMLERCQLHNEMCASYALLEEDLRGNLERIKKGEARKWLAEQDKRWRCVHCGGPIIASHDLHRCHHCNQHPRY